MEGGLGTEKGEEGMREGKVVSDVDLTLKMLDSHVVEILECGGGSRNREGGGGHERR